MGNMKSSIPYILITLVLSTGVLFGAPANFEDEGEDFVRDLLRAVPEKANGLSSSKARKALFEELKLRRTFVMNSEVRKRIEAREDVYSDTAISTVVEGLAEVAGDDGYARFLLEKIKEKRLDEGEQVIVMREMSYQTEELTALIKLAELKKQAARKKPLKELAAFYNDFTGRQKRTASSLDELGLPDSLKVFSDGKPWLFYGRPGDKLTIKKKKVLFIEPTKDSEGMVFFVDNRKEAYLVPMNEVEAAVQAYVKDLENKAKKAEAAKKPDPKVIAAQKAAEEKERKEKAERYQASVRGQLKKIGAEVIAIQEKGELPTEFGKLNLGKELQQVKSADGKDLSDWIYLEGKLNVKAGEKKRLLLISPYRVDENRYLALLDDGSTALIKESQMEQIRGALDQE